jgi:hypothetical protein
VNPVFSRYQSYEISGRSSWKNYLGKRTALQAPVAHWDCQVRARAASRFGRARLALFTKYFQQLVMESLGKEKNLMGEIVHQDIAVYRNKGSTDQHSCVQQVRDGVLNFFVTFVEVRNDRRASRFEVEDGVTSGDYLQGFLRGTRSAVV